MSSSISASERRARVRSGLTDGARRSLVVMAFAAVAAPFLYILAILFQLGSWHGADWWLHDIITLRRMLYSDLVHDLPPEAPKNVIVAGSASLFGVNGGAIAAATGTETLNFGLHAGLDLDLLLGTASRSIDDNDRVILPLEFEIYPRERPSDLSAGNFLAYFYKDATDIPYGHLPELMVAIHPVTVFEGVVDRVAQLFGKQTGFKLDDATVKARWLQSQADPAALQANDSAYDYPDLSAHGDKILVQLTPPSFVTNAHGLRSAASDKVSPYTARVLDDWRSALAARGASLYLTWPVMLEDDAGTIVTPAHWQMLINLAREAAAKGQPIYCDPIPAVIPVQYRYDSAYHVDHKGQLLYSAGLAACLKDIAAKPFDWENADAAVLADQARQRLAALKAPPDPLVFGYERNIRALQGLTAVITASHAATGRYPEALPAIDATEPVIEIAAAPFKADYRSNGTDYKLTVAGSNECFTVREGWPDLIDPHAGAPGSCRYGSWSSGAANW